MNLLETLWWYAGNISGYLWEMLPCMGMGLLGFLLVFPARRKRFQRMDLDSTVLRECAFLLFIMFCAGLAALTLFPANFWDAILNWLTNPITRAYGLDLASFYPSWSEIMSETDYRNLFTPFQEIIRGLYGGPWVFFMLLGNIGIFLPIGFFTALLWRKGRWWKSTLIGFLTSFMIEFVQFFIGRSTDVDDIILNTTGAFLGYWCFAIVKALCPVLISRFHCSLKKG